jgi:branched-chain amino acid transport system substrate-binding protein
MSTRRRFTGFGFILVLLVGILAPGCAQRTEHTVGAILSLTGAGSAYGEDIKRGMDLELEAINAAGGVGGLPLRIVMEDSGSDPARGATAATSLIEQGVSAIIGGDISSVTLAVAPLAEQAEVVLLSPASSNPKITEAGNYIFRIYPSDVVEGTMMAEFALNVMGLKRAMVLALHNDYGQGLKAVFIKRYRQTPNREIVDVQNFKQGQNEWSAEIARIRELGPDGIYLVGYPGELLSFLKALRAENLQTPVLASRSFNEELLQDPATEGVIFPRDPFDPERNERASTFAESYRNKYGEDANIWAANGADSVKLLAEAITEVGHRPEEIRKWLSRVRDWEGACGLVSFNSNGDVDKLPIISIVHEGKFMGFKEYQSARGE